MHIVVERSFKGWQHNNYGEIGLNLKVRSLKVRHLSQFPFYQKIFAFARLIGHVDLNLSKKVFSTVTVHCYVEKSRKVKLNYRAQPINEIRHWDRLLLQTSSNHYRFWKRTRFAPEYFALNLPALLYIITAAKTNGKQLNTKFSRLTKFTFLSDFVKLLLTIKYHTFGPYTSANVVPNNGHFQTLRNCKISESDRASYTKHRNRTGASYDVVTKRNDGHQTSRC